MTQECGDDVRPDSKDYLNVELADVLDVPALQEMMDDYYALTGIGVGILDLKGRVLIGTGWQDICVNFHRAVPESCAFCNESDISLTNGVPPGTFKEYRCKNNMWDIATPIMLGERHIGNIFLGQFLYDDEEPDYELFRAQARRFGYDETEYLAALERVPRWSRETVRRAMGFYAKLARMISKANYDNVILAEALARSEEAERKLRESEHLLSQVQRIGHLGSWSLDLTTNRLIWSDEIYRIFGLQPQEFAATYETFLAVVHPEDRAAVDSAYSRSVQEGKDCYEIEHRIIRKDTGQIRYVHEKCEHIRDGSGRIIRSEGMVHDITERKLAAEEREQYFKFFSTSTELMCIAGTDGYFKKTNPSFSLTLGYSEEELLARPLLTFIHHDDRQPTQDEIARQLQGPGMSINYENRYCAKDGTVHCLAWNAYYFVDKQVIFGVARDITEQKRNATELAAAKEAAESANRAKSEFLANMSHEIRTPMTGIMGMAQLLELTELSAEQKQYLDSIHISSNNLLSLINDVLDLSKIEAGRLELERAVFSLRGSIGELIRTQTSQVRAKGLTITTEIPANLPDYLIGDQLRLKQILLNLVGNAVKFTSRGGITVSVAIEERHDDLALFHFRVADTGIGIKPEVIGKIFAPFSQADSSTTRKFGGTGLGLSICLRLVELMGGRIEVESAEGVGSTFHVVLPFAIFDLQVEQQESRNSEASEAWEGRSLRILLAEDYEISRKFLLKLLQRDGHTLETSENGLEALAKWERNNFDLILMDVQMPGMDGLETTRIIRERETATGAHVPIIAVTAHSLRDDRENFLRQGFDGYVSKPMRFTTLTEEIRRCLKGQEE